MLSRTSIAILFVAIAAHFNNAPPVHAQQIFVEAESFESWGGWKLDTQFVTTVGSPYLLAHGLGRPVKDAATTIQVPSDGSYNVYVRTKDWVAPWKAPGAPGRFQVLLNGKPLPVTFGATSAEWHWQSGGRTELKAGKATLALHDLTGFAGRCDAIVLSMSDTAPPQNGPALARFRRQALGLPEQPIEKSGYDLVVIGGGYSGMGAALSGARMGCKVALIQNRGVLGGNGSSEVRVWSQGLIRRGKYPRVGEIVEEFCDQAKKSPGTFEEFGDAKKEAIIRAEANIDLFLNHHANKVDMVGNQISGIYAFDTRTSEVKKFVGRLYCDATGHGTIGQLAKADWEMTPKGRMGMSNMWAWAEGEQPVDFPETPWALDLEMKDFPYPRDHHGQWFWEGGFDKDPIREAELIRDWNFRAVYGAFNAMKNRDGAEKHKTAYLTWLAYIGGPRESRRLLGDVLLTQDDVVNKREFKDGCVPSTWSIDLHYPKKQYLGKYPENPFISYAVHDRRIDRSYGYPVPYRCFYSRNIENLFMAGRCASVTHEALGTVRVMKTCGMMGEVVGRAASICTQRQCTPREVYEKYWDEMEILLKLPGKAFRKTTDSEIEIPDDALELAGSHGPMTGLNPENLAGIVVDDAQAVKTGKWTAGTGLKGYVGWSYLYSGDPQATIRFSFQAPKAGTYDVRFAYLPHENRAAAAPVSIRVDNQLVKETTINMKQAAPLPNDFISIGRVNLAEGQQVDVLAKTADAQGTMHADAVQAVLVK